MTEGIERKFHSRFDGITRLISHYNELEGLKIGLWPIFLPKDSKRGFQAFFEGRELTENKNMQRVFLQYDLKMPTWPHAEEMPQVIEYELPLTGEISMKDFQEGKIRTYPVNK